jgi:heptosyltransferase-2
VTNFKKILIIQTAFIGDVILTTPLIEVLVDTYPNSEIDFLTIPNSRVLLDSNPHINNLIVFDKRGRDRGIHNLIKFGKKLSAHQYDLCITPHRSLRSAVLTRMTKAKIRIGFDRSAWKSAFTDSISYNPDSHEVERNLSLLSAIGIEVEKSAPVLYDTEEDLEVVNSLMMDHNLNGKHLLAVAPGSVWPTKRWPETYYADLCKQMSNNDIRVVLVGGNEDIDLCQTISEDSGHIVNLAGKLNLRQTYSLLKKCAGILTNDSAPLHLGMAAGIKVFAIFGPTIPEFGFAPFGPKSTIIENRDLKCRPCAIHGSKKCPVKTFDCMKTLTPESVKSEILQNI